MWKQIKDLFGKAEKPVSAAQTYQFKWYELGPENPFPVRILDVRSLTGTVVATTRDRNIAEKYLAMRQSDGRDLIPISIPDSIWIPASLKFQHNGAPLEGLVFKADSMDVKWDIYIYDGCLLFARSWTGELKYRAKIRIEPDAVVITEIQCPQSDARIAPAHIFFLIGTHVMRRVLPHQLPADSSRDPHDMATLSFSLFGNRACYATFEDITEISIPPPPAAV
jgi:hypothetical protein